MNRFQTNLLLPVSPTHDQLSQLIACNLLPAPSASASCFSRHFSKPSLHPACGAQRTWRAGDHITLHNENGFLRLGPMAGGPGRVQLVVSQVLTAAAPRCAAPSPRMRNEAAELERPYECVRLFVTMEPKASRRRIRRLCPGLCPPMAGEAKQQNSSGCRDAAAASGTRLQRGSGNPGTRLLGRDCSRVPPASIESPTRLWRGCEDASAVTPLTLQPRPDSL
jgi:hypothetical protein